LAEKKSKLSSKIEDLMKEMEKDMMRKEGEFSKVVDSLKDDATQSFIVRFETALKQAVIVHPTVDFSELNPCKRIMLEYMALNERGGELFKKDFSKLLTLK